MEFVPKPKRPSTYLSTDDTEDGSVKRPHDPLVASVMEEDQAKKRAKKGDGSTGGNKKKKKDGLTLEQVEELEGGVIKESKTGMAATQRADRRKRKSSHDETTMLDVKDLKRVEEELELPEDDGIALEPFNLEKEREEGRFDESGNYVENKAEEDADAEDPWLASEEANVLSEEVREKVERQKARMASADEAPTITPKQAADLMRQLIAILQPGENVTKALKRLRPVKAKVRKGKANSSKKEEAQEDSGQKELFEQLTEASSTLMDAGELDVYSTPREDFEAQAIKHPVVEEAFDMFGDEAGPSNGTQAEKGGAHQRSDNVSASSNQLPQEAQPKPSVQAHQEVDYSSWPVKELARFLKERGHDPTGIIEKADLVKKVAEVAAQGPEGEQPTVPPGYVYDPSSKYFYNSENGMYYDVTTGAYFSASDGHWYTFDTAMQNFVKLS